MRTWANSVNSCTRREALGQTYAQQCKNKTNIKTPGKNCNTGRRMWFVLQTIKR